MNKPLFTKGFVLVAVACAVLLFSGGQAMAASKNCSLIGSWYGGFSDGPGNDWMLLFARGSSATSGSFYMEWPTSGGTHPVGVWEAVDTEHYKFTFTWYGLDANGAVVWTARCSGMATLLDCDHSEETWVTELWVGPGRDMNTEPPDDCWHGASAERRMPVVQATCEQ